MLPSISSGSLAVSENEGKFRVKLESVEDLFYDGLTDPTEEIMKLHAVLNSTVNRGRLNQIYRREKIDRLAFGAFAKKYCEVEIDTANMIFSCATDAYGTNDGDNEDELPDLDMTRSQFAAAVVRLANLWGMMNEGMQNTSMLAKQTESFLSRL